MPDKYPSGEMPPSISSAEWEAMKPIWERGAMTARDVHSALPPEHGWAINTVKTLLSRLVAKGVLEYEQVGNTYVYRARFGRDEVTRITLRGFLNRVLDGSVAPILAHFIEEGNLNEREIAEFRRLLDEKEQKLGKRRKKS
ncbi:MAG TPA: BlaI/MecI/CopY family transcriptional regulator [Candidatus Sumerlaeota bacterium]|mgnify:CR=1 FL=1|nr:BlaI/MecI/CopY family transcriptional regulator [Candidatus Sumerlaeota bacterium]